MDAVDKKFIKYLDAIDLAFDKKLDPESLMRIIGGLGNKVTIKQEVLMGLFPYLQNRKHKSPRAAIKAFIRSNKFKTITKGIAKKKKFFAKKEDHSKHQIYASKDFKTILKDLSPSEFTRYKFVENIYNEFKKGFKIKGGITSQIFRK